MRFTKCYLYDIFISVLRKYCISHHILTGGKSEGIYRSCIWEYGQKFVAGDVASA